MKPEDALKAEVLKYLKTRPDSELHLRMNSGKVKVARGYMNLCPEGTADFLFCVPDPRWCELKVAGQKTKRERIEAQAAFRDKVVALGHRYAICMSVVEVAEFLK